MMEQTANQKRRPQSRCCGGRGRATSQRDCSQHGCHQRPAQGDEERIEFQHRRPRGGHGQPENHNAHQTKEQGLAQTARLLIDGHLEASRCVCLDKAMTNRGHDKLQGLAAGRRFATVLADPPWQFVNRTGKVAPEHRRLSRYPTLTTDEICALPVAEHLAETAHCYLWVPNALLPDGLARARGLGVRLQAQHRLAEGPQGWRLRRPRRRLLLPQRHRDCCCSGPAASNARTLAPGRRQVNFIATRKREHSRKPDEQYAIIEACSPGPYLELFAAASAAIGRVGEIRPQTTIARPGRPTPIIPQLKRNCCRRGGLESREPRTYETRNDD